MRTRRIRAASALAAILWLASPVAANAQGADTSRRTGGAKWALIDGLGYGGLGFGLGVLGIWNMENTGPNSGFGPPGEALVIVGASTVLGIAGGAVMGRRAQRSIAEGRPLGGAHRVGVIAGGVLAGSAVGAVASAALINGEGEGTFLGTDEQTFTLLTIAGSVLGAFYVWSRGGELSFHAISLAPAAFGNGEYGVRARVTF